MAILINMEIPKETVLLQLRPNGDTYKCNALGIDRYVGQAKEANNKVFVVQNDRQIVGCYKTHSDAYKVFNKVIEYELADECYSLERDEDDDDCVIIRTGYYDDYGNEDWFYISINELEIK